MRPLAAAGNVNVDLIMGPVAPWPAHGTEIFVTHDEVRPGGCAGNVALAWRALGAEFQIAGSVGDDAFGQYLTGQFGPIAARWPVASSATTLSVGMTHPDGERTFFTTMGHLPHFSFGDVRRALDGEALRGGILLVCGTFLLPALMAEFDALVEWADAHDIELALDTGWPPGGWSPAALASGRHWLGACQYALLNETEATSLAGVGEVEAAARVLAGLTRRGDAEIVVKRGPLGALAVSRNGPLFSLPGRPVHVVDTIGAGDAFNAGFLLAIAGGTDGAGAVLQGIDTASVAISTSPRRYAGPADILERSDP